MLKLPFSGSGFLFVFLLLMMFQTSDSAHDCPPSSCGGTNISYPFRLQTDPISCGDDKYTLSCENNFTVLHLFKGGKYYVKAIDYDNFTIQLVDASVDKDDCSSLPSDFPNFPLMYMFSFFFEVEDPSYTLFKYRQHSERWSEGERLPAEMINFIKCKNAVNSSVYLDTSPCINSSLSHSETVYTYAYLGEMKGCDLRDDCSLEMVSLMLPTTDSKNRNLSFIEVHRQMAFGFELSWHPINCRHCVLDSCYLDNKDHLQCLNTTKGMQCFTCHYTIIFKSFC
ncbi:hypothetical protein M5689_022290 [Euphorbia peplus]|nr:hypothetical protein M5689_022290 [Euphorbia peplus]